jgi:3-oxoacid CoA-transferase
MKTVKQISAEQAAFLVKDGDIIFAGGFGMTGNPVHLLHALAQTKTKNLTYIGNNVGEPNLGGGKLLLNGQIRKMIGSFYTSNQDAVRSAQNGLVEYELLPQGTLAEAIRAGGAGIGGFYTPTSLGTVIAEGKRKPSGLMEKDMCFQRDCARMCSFYQGLKADTAGNLQYRMTEQNFNKGMATAADLVIAEVEQILPVGALEPENIHTPCCYVNYLVQAHLTLDDLGTSASLTGSSKKVDKSRMNMAKRAFRE